MNDLLSDIEKHLDFSKTMESLKASGYYIVPTPFGKRKFTAKHPKGWYKTDDEREAELWLRMVEAGDRNGTR